MRGSSIPNFCGRILNVRITSYRQLVPIKYALATLSKN
jgi:hypothetical protein